MRFLTAAVAGLALVAASTAVATADRSKRRRKPAPKAPRTNAPAGWTWPVTPAMERQGDECLIRLDERGVDFRRGKRTDRIATPVIVPDMVFGGVALVPRFRKPPFPMDCHLALALARIGPTLRALGVAQLRFSTIHDVRRVRVNGGEKDVLSKHSYGLAVDVFEVVTDDGTVWTIETDYLAGDSVLHALEAAVNDGGRFRRLLSPGNDPVSHNDHFHFEAKVPRVQLTAEERKAERAEKRRARKAERARKAKRARNAKRARKAKRRR